MPVMYESGDDVSKKKKNDHWFGLTFNFPGKWKTIFSLRFAHFFIL